MNNFLKPAVLCAAVLLFASCDETATDKVQPPVSEDAASTSGTLKLNGEIISTPSPVLVVSLLQKNNVPYNSALTNPVVAKDRYINETRKALNLGLYGADLAYTSTFNAGQSTNDYVDVVAGLANDLGILEKIDKGAVNRLTSHLNNADSIMKMSTEFFKLSDRYLRSNEQDHLSSYILIGGWVEGLHLASEAAKTNQAVATRMGEQKYSAPSIAKLSSQLNDQSFAPIKVELEALCAMLGELKTTYKHEKPINDREAKTTYLMSKTSVDLTTEQVAAISEQVEKVRNLIIQ